MLPIVRLMRFIALFALVARQPVAVANEILANTSTIVRSCDSISTLISHKYVVYCKHVMTV